MCTYTCFHCMTQSSFTTRGTTAVGLKFFLILGEIAHFTSKCQSFTIMHGLVVLSIITLSLKSAACDIDVIVKQCREDWCYALRHNDTRYQGPEYYEKLSNFFASGIPQLIYSDITKLTQNSEISATCRTTLDHVRNELIAGKEWPFRMIDSSGKISPGFLEGSVTSFGDYDECVHTAEPNVDASAAVTGMYCIADIFPEGYVGKERRMDGRVSLNQMQRFNDSAYYFGVCLPSSCSNGDVKEILSTVLKPFPLRVYGHSHCDTLEQNSLWHRISNMTTASAVSLIFIMTVVSLVFYGTFNHLFRPEAQGLLYFKSFSLIENFYKLIVIEAGAKEESYTTIASTGMKMVLIFCGTAAHIYACIELPIGFFLMSHHKNMEKMMSTTMLNPLFGDAGIVVSASMAGFANFFMTYPLAKAGKLSPAFALIEKCSRYIPVILCVNALDMIWYLPFTGPLASRVGAVVADKCSKYWWRSVLFISNIVGDSIDICSGHTYSLSVDVHLFLLGLVAVLLFARRPAYGIAYCLLMSAIGICLGIYYATVHRLTPTLLVARDPSNFELERFLIYIHMATSGYLISYFSAMLLGYIVFEGYLNKFAIRVNHSFWLTSLILISNVAQFAPALTNTLDLIQRHHVPYFIVGIRILKAMEMMALLAYASLLDLNERMRQKESRMPVTMSQGKKFSLWKMLTRLSFAMYMSNYLFIRADFFTARIPFHNDLYVYSKRLITSLIILIPWSIVYHLFFIAPFMSLMNDAKRRPKRKSE